MAKKFGKILLATAAIGTAVAAAYYYFQKKDADFTNADNEDEDYDDDSNDESDSSDSSRNYVPLNCESVQSSEAADAEDSLTPLSEQIAHTEETVEDFFDEDDSSNEEPAIQDN